MYEYDTFIELKQFKTDGIKASDISHLNNAYAICFAPVGPCITIIFSVLYFAEKA